MGIHFQGGLLVVSVCSEKRGDEILMFTTNILGDGVSGTF